MIGLVASLQLPPGPGYGPGDSKAPRGRSRPGCLAQDSRLRPAFPLPLLSLLVDLLLGDLDELLGEAAWRRSRVSAVPGRAGSRCPAGRIRCPAIRTAVRRWLRRPGQLTTADEQSNMRGPAVAPQRRLRLRRRPAAAGHRGRCLGGRETAHRGRLGGPLLLPEPRSVSIRLVSGRLLSAADPAGACRVSTCYRNRSPAWRPLDGCRHRRYASAS